MSGDGPRLPEGWRLAAHDILGSTNDEAKRLLHAGAPDFTLVWARAQESGRGRDGRVWSSPPGNVYASLLLRPLGAPLVAAQLGFVTALAIAEALAVRVPEIALKWPNDVLQAGRKIAGILLETEGVTADGIEGLIVGFGVNVQRHPVESRLPATSLHAAGDAGARVEDVLSAIAGAFARWHAIWAREGFAPVRLAWLARAHGLGGPIEVRLPRETLAGRFRDVDPRGVLILETASGPRAITAGDVFFP
jgi:BirA family biotin operon repressor/biotin-[acetyl-CoA-carboxylase] ligase